MKKIITSTIVAVVIVVAIVLIIKSKPTESYVVKIGNIPIMLSKLPLEIAQQKGFFEDAGITVQVTELASSNLVSDALLRGDVDITPEISILPFITAEIIDQGKAKIFSVTDLAITDVPFDSIIVKSDSRINDINDLKGKKIGVFPGTTAINTLKLLFEAKGVDSSTIQFIQLPPAQQLTALSAGSIDALHAYEPTVSIALVDNKMKRVYGAVYAEILNHSPIGAGLLSTKFINEHPGQAKKVVQALNKAYDYIRTNDKEAREIAQSMFKFSPEVSAAVSLPYFDHSNQIDKGSVNKLLDMFVLGEEIKSKPDLTNAFYQP
ncbi:MAG: NrtA/SsuA/CpmA family ABC transporter substrate-binding protein [Candidatus Moraniibacteriota bacterium]